MIALTHSPLGRVRGPVTSPLDVAGGIDNTSLVQQNIVFE
jgi:hypothetical protein